MAFVLAPITLEVMFPRAVARILSINHPQQPDSFPAFYPIIIPTGGGQ